MFELMPRSYRMPMPYRPMREFDEFFEPAREMMKAFSTDIIDNGDGFTLNAELPGFKKEDIKINIEKDLLTISAERKSEEKEDEPNYVRKERFYGSYSRCFDLKGIDTDKIEASYNDGVLSLVLPKKAEEVPSARSIEIK